MRVRKLFQHEAPAALRLVESVESLALQGLLPRYLAQDIRKQYEDAQVPRTGDEPIPFYYKR